MKLLLLSAAVGLVSAAPLTASAPSSITATRLPDGSVTLLWPAVTGSWYQVETRAARPTAGAHHQPRHRRQHSGQRLHRPARAGNESLGIVLHRPRPHPRLGCRHRPQYLRLKTGLEASGIPHLRVIYDTTGFSTGNAHSIQNVPDINRDMLSQWQAWLVARGVLP